MLVLSLGFAQNPKEKNDKHIYKITFFRYNEIYFSELFYGFGDDTTATLKKQRRIDTDNRIKAAAVEVFAEYGYERAQLSYMSKLFGRISERA